MELSLSKAIIETDRLRELLYGILTGAVEKETDVSLSQNMGVALSSAVRKEGVNILQLQSFNYQALAVAVTDALKLIDQARPVPHLIEDQRAEPDSENDLEIVIEDSLANDTPLDEFLMAMTGKYVGKCFKDNSFKVKDTYEQLGISYARFTKIRKHFQL